jgi:hypothetical protein
MEIRDGTQLLGDCLGHALDVIEHRLARAIPLASVDEAGNPAGYLDLHRVSPSQVLHGILALGSCEGKGCCPTGRDVWSPLSPRGNHPIVDVITAPDHGDQGRP